MEESLKEKEKIINEFSEKLNLIIKEIEERKTTQLIDILTAVLLSLATVGSAWCAYQSNLWNGIQTFEIVDANRAGRLSTENSLRAAQLRSIDAIIFMQYLNAEKTGNKDLAAFYYSRFSPNLKTATDEWLKKDPYNNINSPNSPLAMQTYHINEEAEIENQLQINTNKMESANKANKTSDTYVLLTVLFAGVLFFGGIASTIQSTFIKNFALVLSGIIFVATFIVLCGMPVASVG